MVAPCCCGTCLCNACPGVALPSVIYLTISGINFGIYNYANGSFVLNVSNVGFCSWQSELQPAVGPFGTGYTARAGFECNSNNNLVQVTVTVYNPAGQLEFTLVSSNVFVGEMFPGYFNTCVPFFFSNYGDLPPPAWVIPYIFYKPGTGVAVFGLWVATG